MLWTEASGHRMPDRKAWSYDKPEGSQHFQYQIAEYLSIRSAAANSAAEPLPTVMTCPAAYALRASTQPWGRTYSINGHAVSSEDGKALSGQWYPQRITDIEHPSAMVLYMDGAVGSGSGGNYWSNVQYSQVDPAAHSAPLQYPHGGAINAVFVDGHVRRILREQMIEDYSQGMIRFWRYNAP